MKTFKIAIWLLCSQATRDDLEVDDAQRTFHSSSSSRHNEHIMNCKNNNNDQLWCTRRSCPYRFWTDKRNWGVAIVERRRVIFWLRRAFCFFSYNFNHFWVGFSSTAVSRVEPSKLLWKQINISHWQKQWIHSFSDIWSDKKPRQEKWLIGSCHLKCQIEGWTTTSRQAIGVVIWQKVKRTVKRRWLIRSI